MSIKTQITDGIKTAMRAKDTATLSTLRNIKAKITEKEKLSGEVSEEEIQGMIEKYVKEREQAIDNAKQADREDLIPQEEAEIALLKPFLPEKMTEEETRAFVQKLVDEGKNNIGAIMKEAGPLGGKVDKKLLSQIAKELTA